LFLTGRDTFRHNRLSVQEEGERPVREEADATTSRLVKTIEMDNSGMHATDTVDYVIVLSGEVWLELDDGAEVHLKQGDCVCKTDQACVAKSWVGALCDGFLNGWSKAPLTAADRSRRCC